MDSALLYMLRNFRITNGFQCSISEYGVVSITSLDLSSSIKIANERCADKSNQPYEAETLKLY